MIHVLEEIPLQPVEKSRVMQADTLQPVEDSSVAGIHLQPMADSTPEHGHMLPKGSCSLWRPSVGAGSWQELCSVERSPGRSRLSGRSSGLWRNLSGVVHSWRTYPMERIHAKTVHEVLFPQGRTPHKSRGIACGKNKQQKWHFMNWPQPPSPVHQHHLWGEDRSYECSYEFSLARRRCGEKVVLVSFYFSLSYFVII